MTDTADRREARKRRILENSESRLERITGQGKRGSNKVNQHHEQINSKSSTKNIIMSENVFTNRITSENSQVSSKQGKIDFRDYGLSNSKAPLKKSDYVQKLFLDSQIEQKKNESLKMESINGQSNKLIKQPFAWFTAIFFYKSFFNVLLAVFMNLLLFFYLNVCLYQGCTIISCGVISLTRRCFENKYEETQNISMFTAALLLCNIKPEIVHTLKKILACCSVISTDVALYITSFVILNWMMSVIFPNSITLNFPI